LDIFGLFHQIALVVLETMNTAMIFNGMSTGYPRVLWIF